MHAHPQCMHIITNHNNVLIIMFHIKNIHIIVSPVNSISGAITVQLYVEGSSYPKLYWAGLSYQKFVHRLRLMCHSMQDFSCYQSQTRSSLIQCLLTKDDLLLSLKTLKKCDWNVLKVATMDSDACVTLVLTLYVILSSIDQVIGNIHQDGKPSHQMKGQDYVAIFFFTLIAGLLLAIICTILLRGKLLRD